ncbi:DNA-packaging protein [Sodalis glossinidius]|uniref:DNA-packaging protein n=1 Tax=Sodalis glossinidius TaxID=63612 RepID=UPI0014124A74|nr:DNA-packaging protein [Sodalis glossinidius]
MGRQTKNKVGCPSELAQSLEKAKAYLLGDYEKLGDVVPSVAGLACYLGISRSTAQEYAKENEEFSGTLEAIKTLQENRLINKGLTGDFNATITKLMLANHGYSDKQELTGKDGGALQVETRPLSEIFKNG